MKPFFISESFTTTRNPAFAHFSEHEKKAIWRNLLSIQNKEISLVAMLSKDVIGLGESRHHQTWLNNGFSLNENLQWFRIELKKVLLLLSSN